MPIPAEAWRELQDAYLGSCAYCFTAPSVAQDHIVPLSRGGAHTIDNIAPACKSCNSSKGARPLIAFLASKHQPTNQMELAA